MAIVPTTHADVSSDPTPARMHERAIGTRQCRLASALGHICEPFRKCLMGQRGVQNGRAMRSGPASSGTMQPAAEAVSVYTRLRHLDEGETEPSQLTTLPGQVAPKPTLAW